MTSQLLLANKSGVRLNLTGWRQLRHCRAHFPQPPAATGRAAELQQRGVVRFDDHLDPALVDSVSKAFAELIADDNICRDLGVGHAEAHRYLIDPNVAIPDIARLLSPAVHDIISSAYGSPFRVRHVRAYRNSVPPRAGDDKELFGNFWHVDPEMVCDLRYFVYLTQPTTVAQGALETLDRATTRRLMRTGYLERGRVVGPARRYLDRLRHQAAQEGSAGSAILIDAQRCLHRAGVPDPGEHRDIVQFWLTPTVTPMADNWGDTVRDPVWSDMHAKTGSG